MQLNIYGKDHSLLRLRGVKTLFVMKWVAILIFASAMQVSAKGYAQKISLKQDNATLEEVLNAIHQQTGYLFLYDTRALKGLKGIDVNVKDATLQETLDQCVAKYSLGYLLEDKTILIFPREATQEFLKPSRVVEGIVTDGNGNPLSGVTVRIKNSNIGTITDQQGHFHIEISNNNSVLQFSYLGFETQEVMVGNQSKLNITLQASTSSLEQLVVVGYGTQKKSDLTGAVASIGSDEFVKGITTNALQLIAGKASGVHVSQVNAEPGGELSIRIRGAGSINSNNSALIVIDGLPAGSTANINPSDIKSIEILKDASAAAIYGTRAANGVVLITTKKGQQGPAKVSYNTYWAYQTPSAKLDVLNATQYMHYLNDINKDLGRPLPFTEEQIKKAGVGTDWQDELLRNAWATNQQISVSGGNKNVKYYTSLRYLDQDGILISSGIKQYNVLANIEITPNDKFKFGINLNGSLNIKDKIANNSNTGSENADPLNAATQFDPTLSPQKDENGEYERNPTIALDNPIALAYGYDYRDHNNRIYGNMFGEYEIIKGLKLTLRLGGDINNNRSDNYTDRTTQRGKANGGIADINSNNRKYWLTEGLVHYDKTFEQHHISLLGGATWEKFMNVSQHSHATGLLFDVTNTNLLQSGDVNSMRVSSGKTIHTLQSLFARANYSFRNRYLLTATIRRDGTSRFSEQNKYAYFPSLALGWRITEEPFMKNLPVFSNLKLRLSYGQMGNEGIGNFETIATYVAGENTVLGQQIVNGAHPARLVNEDLKWETTEEYNFGLDFGLVHNRISGSLAYYIKTTKDQLFNKPVPMTTGFSNIRVNFGDVRNSGFDFAVTSHNLIGKFRWMTDITLSTLKNEVTKLPPFIGQIITGGIIANIPGFALVQQGYSMRAFYGYKITGIFQENEDIKSSAQPDAQPGWPKFLDKNKDGKITASDRVVLGKPFPDFTYSFNNTFSYRNFSLSIYWIGVQGIRTFNGNVIESIFPINFNRNIMNKFYLDRWTSKNPAAKYPSGANSAIYFGNGKMINSYSIQNASYLRLKNVSLSYNIPLNNSNIFRSILVSLTGENLLTFTDFDGYDPAGNQNGSSVVKSSYNNYPLARVISIGAKVTF